MLNGELKQIDVGLIDVEPQIRESFSDDTLLGLAQSMKNGGLRQPIVVRPAGERFVLLTGERRLRAAKLAGIATIAAVVDHRKYDPKDVLVGQLVENVQRDDLLPLEKAKALDQLIQTTSSTGAEVAAKLGLSPATVSKLVSLLTLPAEIQRQVAEGRLAPSTAYELAKVTDPSAQADLAAQAAEGKLTRDDVSAGAKRKAKPRKRKRGGKLVFPVGDGRSIAVSGPTLTMATLIELLEGLVGRIKSVGESCSSVSELVNALAGKAA